MTTVGLVLIAIPLGLALYAYLLYPLLLALLSAGRRTPQPGDPREWPELTINLPVYNEERALAGTIEALLGLDYPAERRHILVVSDCSTDRTDDIARSFAQRGVRLLRLPRRGGKTAAENAAAAHIRGELVVNIDATTRLHPASLKALVRVFQDPTVGVASGRDVSVGAEGTEATRAESSYVGYEMWVRGLETRLGTIVGASGCFFAIRRALFEVIVPEALSRDFAAPLIAREHGYRSVSVPDAVCYVPRAANLRTELQRKARTMARGLETLWYKRGLLNPLRYGRFAWMLASHKLARWAVFPTTLLAVVGLGVLARESDLAATLLGVATGFFLLGVVLAYWWPRSVRLPAPLATVGFLAGIQVAALLAWAKALRGELNPIWEPTRRP
jgi:cellulose synthase/poly-beta-1,6-N-acetylglucosamine synthase-like glycosyltransferase